jgi:hypothetical protein
VEPRDGGKVDRLAVKCVADVVEQVHRVFEKEVKAFRFSKFALEKRLKSTKKSGR